MIVAGHQWDALLPHIHGHHTYVSAIPEHLRPQRDDLIAAFHGHEVLPTDTWQTVRDKTLDRDYQSKVRASLLELRDPVRQR